MAEPIPGPDWADARKTPIAGDASGRRFLRLETDGASAVLMDDPDGDVRPFLRADRHFESLGLSVPAIHAADPEAGRVLMEDLGDDLFATRIEKEPMQERPLMEAAVDLLVHLHRYPAPDWAAPYGPSQMAAALSPLWEHYALGVDGTDLKDRMRVALSAHSPSTDVLLHRDYHAQNLLWLPERIGVARVGVIDFQDALAGHRAYDLASLLQDARRDVSPEIETAMIRRYTDAVATDPDAFRAAYALQSLQRHLRILGIFARLARDGGKPGYLSLIPRVLGYVDRCLAHPVAAPLRAPVSRILEAAQ